MEAVLYGRVDAVQALLDAGADRLIEVRVGRTLIMFVVDRTGAVSSAGSCR